MIHLATAPKSNAVKMAIQNAKLAARETGHLNPPKHILNAPTDMMKDQGYGDGYIYDHDTEHTFSGQHYFPEGVGRLKIYDPKGEGREKSVREKLAYLDGLRKRLQNKN